MNRDNETFLEIVRLGLGHVGRVLPSHINWTAIETLAEQQGLSAVLVDGVELLPEGKRPPKEVLLQWIGETLQGYEYRYEAYKKAIAELAGFYNSHGFKMMVLKGYACGMNWPKPEHRPCGDIDIWLFGKQKEADALLMKTKRIEVDNTHHHHSVFNWGEFTVENHYDFINVHHHKSNAEIEYVLKELGQDDSHFINVLGEKVYLPSPNLHALFLLKHMMMHFAAEGITLRHVLDWGFLAKAHSHEIDWEWLEGVLEQYGMMPAYNIFNAICVENLGFDSNVFPKVQFNPSRKERVLQEIISPEFGRGLPKCFINRVIFKLRRWKANEWKHQLCYRESMHGSFWMGVWNHLLKPSSI